MEICSHVKVALCQCQSPHVVTALYQIFLWLLMSEFTCLWTFTKNIQAFRK